MTTRQVFIRMAIYGAVLGAADAFLGRALQASPDVNLLLLLLAAAWVGSALGSMQRVRIAVPAALTLIAAFLVTYAGVAHLLVGWNNSVPWHADPGELAWFFLAVAAVAMVFAKLADRSRAAATAERDAPR
jgi:hypothetical protein